MLETSICRRDALLRSALSFRTRIAMTDDPHTDGSLAAAVPPPDSRRGARRRIDSKIYDSGWSLNTGCRGASARHSSSVDSDETSKNGRVTRPSAK